MGAVEQTIAITVDLAGWYGGPGSMSLQFSGTNGQVNQGIADDAAEWSGAWMEGVSAYLVTDVLWSIRGEALEIDVESGKVTQAYSVTPTYQSGAGKDDATSLSRAVAMFLDHRSSEYADGRRIRGGLYFGPLGASAVEDDGTLSPLARTLVATVWASTFPGGQVTHAVRRAAVYDAEGDLTRAGVGFTAVPPVSKSTVPAMLRSRRD